MKIEKIQDAFFWVAAAVLAALAFVNSSRTLNLEFVPATFPRETVFFTLSALAICFATLRGGPELRGRKRVAFWLLVAFALWSILATLWAVNVPGHSRELIELAFFAGWAFALSSLLMPLSRARNLTYVLGFSGGVVGAAVALGRFIPGVFHSSLATWPFGNANAAGMFCAFATVINVGLLIETLRKHKLHEQQVILHLACAAMTLAGLAFTFSKGASLGLIIGIAVLMWQFFPKLRKWTAIALPSLLIVLAVGYVVYASRKEELWKTTSGFRVGAWKASMSQIGDAPFGGRGLGSFYAYFPQHSLPAISGHPKMGDTVFHAHSNVLEIGTELGIIGMLLFVAFTVYIGILPLRKTRSDKSERDRLEAIWLAGFLTISVHALVAVLFFWTETVLYYWTAAGVLLALGRKTEPAGEEDEGKPSISAFAQIKRRLPFLAVAVVSLAGLWYVGVYQEMLGRRYVAMREKRLKIVRKDDKTFSQMVRGGQSKTKEFRNLQARRMQLYREIIAALDEELGLVHVQRMRSDTYYQLGSAYYNTGYPREALHYFKLVVADAPGYVNTDYFIGRAYEGMRTKEGKKLHSPEELRSYQDKAIEALEGYLAANVRAKMSGEATLFLAKIYGGREDLIKAIEVINRHLEAKPESDQKYELTRYRNTLVARISRKSRRGAK